MLRKLVAPFHTRPQRQAGTEVAGGQTTVVDCGYTGHATALQTAITSKGRAEVGLNKSQTVRVSENTRALGF